ncbi:MAG: RcpC/CpaB family pilus assembly protein, partial [Kineosporiaceae bacterium]
DPGLMAVTVDIGDPNRVADLLVGGSRVAIWVIINPEGGGRSEARLFMSNVKVLTTGTSGTIRSSSTQAPQENGSTALVTLQVDQKQAGEILVAQAAGDLYFTLLSGNAEPTEQAYNEGALVPNG